MHLLIAPNAFKHALDANKAAMAIAEGIEKANSDFSCTLFPIGDGGDGTGALLTAHCGGETITTETVDALGGKITASFGLIDQGGTAVIEMAAASGLHLLTRDELAPLKASTYGTGLQIKQALDRSVQKIILCVGGSATVDGGAGILHAVGIRFLDKNGHALPDTPSSLVSVESIDTSAIDSRIKKTELVILCDVTNTLLGKQGAANIFGPQKGASPADVELLEQGLTKLNEVVARQFGIDMSELVHGGAAGGTAAGLYALLNAKLVNGINHFLSLTGFDDILLHADFVITGEGRIDLQTLDGKAPFGVASLAKKRSIPVIAMAGSIDEENRDQLYTVFNELICINPKDTDLPTALSNTYTNLVNTARQFVESLAGH